MVSAEEAGAPRLVEALGRMVSGEGGAREAFEVFLDTRVYCLATEKPGVHAIGASGAGAVPVFTSLEVLARYRVARGEITEVRWFSTTGEDLLGLLPKGYAVLIDPGTDHAVSFGRPASGHGAQAS